MRSQKNENIQDASGANADVQNQFEIFKAYFQGPPPKEANNALIYRAKSSKDAKAKLTKAWSFITSLGFLLTATIGPDNTVIIKDFKTFSYSKF